MTSNFQFYEPEVPEQLRQPRREVNLLWYEPSRIIAVKRGNGDVGAIRFAVRQDKPIDGLITDLVVEETHRSRGLARDLIARAEGALKDHGAARIEVVVLDGQGLTEPFLEKGFRPFRKTVVLGWDLTKAKEIQTPTDIVVDLVDRIDPEEIAEFIFASYQPYWQWWKETGEEAAVGRAEYPVDEPTDVLAQQRSANWDRVIAALERFNTDTPQRMVIARKDGRIVGLCDGKANSDESMEWGVLVNRDVGGGKIGSLLIAPALGWLKDQGLKTAQVTTTSGLDDYDPTVYLYTLVGGATIRGEFLVLRKTPASILILSFARMRE